MSPVDQKQPLEEAAAARLLRLVRNKGVKLWSENGQLLYKAPQGALTADEREQLKRLRNNIIALLEGAATPNVLLSAARAQCIRAPLSFSQLAHWRLYRLHERPAARQIASATRLSGSLSPEALAKATVAVTQRHDSLRTRIVTNDGTPEQHIDDSYPFQVEMEDLSALPAEARQSRVKQLIDEEILTSIDISTGPLFGVRLLKLHEHEHILISVMEHMISDGISMNVFLRDLFAAYVQARREGSTHLPPASCQFWEHARSQRDAHPWWKKAHGQYWAEQLSDYRRVAFPTADTSAISQLRGWHAVALHLSRDMKAELIEWCRSKQTTPAIAILTAYVALALRWCNVSEIIIQYEVSGRVRPELEDAIGYFAAPLYLRVQLLHEDTFADLLERVTERYCRAYEHADSSYMESQVARPPFTRSAAFNWVPQQPRVDLSSLTGSADLTIAPVPFAHPLLQVLERDNDPMLLLYDTENGLVGDVSFPAARFPVETMERFVETFHIFVRKMLRQPQSRVTSLPVEVQGSPLVVRTTRQGPGADANGPLIGA